MNTLRFLAYMGLVVGGYLVATEAQMYGYAAVILAGGILGWIDR